MDALFSVANRDDAVAVGIDMVAVRDVAASVARFGARYTTRIYTAAEIRYCTDTESTAVASERFAARFAAKEAAIKALRLSDDGFDWRSIEVQRGDDGACTLALHGAAREAASRARLHGFSVSISHEAEYAVAVVAAWPAQRSAA